ncbi:MAG: hypothetical protein QM809_16310 [Gordonia sp. (in: high G+C Gram-positive bacteria)]
MANGNQRPGQPQQNRGTQQQHQQRRRRRRVWDRHTHRWVWQWS